MNHLHALNKENIYRRSDSIKNNCYPDYHFHPGIANDQGYYKKVKAKFKDREKII